ncbi:YCF48-related protein [Pontiellaceae bacterium B1224]|nr:YCF48-related protein [Pontiellaceae bacterium B1224]
MKLSTKPACLVALTLFLGQMATSVLGADSEWSWLNPSPQGNDLNDLHAIDDNTIVAVGTVGTIIRSDDGGQTWTVQDSGSIWELNAVWFTDAQNGWVGSQRGMLRTTDGGITWSQQTGISVNDVIYTLHFVSNQKGWAAGGSGKVYSTVDGGNSWTPQATGLPLTVWLDDVFFVDDLHGWAVGSGGTIIRTTDGGASWSPATSGLVGTIEYVYFLDQNNGWTLGGGLPMKTTDGGQNWTLWSLPSFGTSETPSGVHFYNLQEGWLTTTIQIWKTVDGGDTWESKSTLGLPDGRAKGLMDFRDPDNLWVAGETGVAYKSVDGGEIWTHQTPGVRLSWNDSSFVDATLGWVVGEWGAIYRTTDGGQSWGHQPLPDNFTSGLLSVDFVDGQTGWCVGAVGRIYATTNGGATWVQQTSGSGRTLRSVFFLDAQNGWVVGDNGTILRTTNGGQIWSPQMSGVAAGLRAVEFIDENTGWVVGRTGTVLHTTDGGEEWKQVLNAPTGNLNDVYFQDVQTGWIVGLGVIYRTINGGADWTFTVFPLNQFQNLNTSLNSIHFADTNHGWAVGQSGVMVSTSDGGDNWELIFNPIQNPFDPPTPLLTDLWLNSVHVFGAESVMVVGAGGLVLRLSMPIIVGPTLSSSLTDAGQFRISWPQDGNTWVLRGANQVNTQVWDTVLMDPVDDAMGNWFLDLPVVSTSRFFFLEREEEP